ncbi:MAG TPA: M1 family aminopeptidase [Bryobacteraceae bacterium]|nr:M1 family aminopeptidase [Bryobacteraceae bacterium]
MRLYYVLLLAPACLTAQAGGQPSANSDANYRALRDGKLAESYTAENILLTRDAGTIAFKSGEVSFAAPVLGHSAIGIFTGQGHFHLKAATSIEDSRLRFVTGSPEVDEDFDAAMLYFSDGTADEVKKQAKAGPVSAKNDTQLQTFRAQLRSRIENPRSFMEAELYGDSIPNLDAQLLADLYHPQPSGTFILLMHGRKHSQMRFLVEPAGAIPSMGPEEVALINVDPGGQQDGIWYLAHTVAETEGHSASSSEEKRAIAPEHYDMDVHVARNDRLAAKVTVRFKALSDGARALPFRLLPNLRVSAVTIAGAPAGFIQEGARQDAALWLILPQPSVKDHVYAATFEYEGNKVIFKEGSGNFSVDAREIWYPAANPFHDWATYDITFHSPKKLTLVGVGKMVREEREGDEVAAEWKSDEPLPVAGFNFGDFKKKERSDDVTRYTIEAYATSQPPDWLRGATQTIEVGPHEGAPDSSSGMVLSPSAMANQVLIDAMNSVRLYTQWFGPVAFGRLAVTQQPAFDFGQSWPTLVYLPVSAFLDPTQRWELLGRNTFRFSKEFINVVTAHEVAHQWWGHTVGWASYHDQWLSEGFADFSASLFLEATDPKGHSAQQFWESERHEILDKNQFGNRANDAGPLWMGLRLASFRASSAYQSLTYAKGAFILNMLRSLMQDRQTGDKPFIDMMHDFATTYRGRNASTEDFQRIVEKHMSPDMNLDGNGRMDWFFGEWVYGTEVPAYRLEYSLGDSGGGKTLLTLRVSQQDVSRSFKMRVPLYVDYDGHPAKLGSIPMAGETTTQEIKVNLGHRPRRVTIAANDDILATSITAK